jgi:hypothetical protein
MTMDYSKIDALFGTLAALLAHDVADAELRDLETKEVHFGKQYSFKLGASSVRLTMLVHEVYNQRSTSVGRYAVEISAPYCETVQVTQRTKAKPLDLDKVVSVALDVWNRSYQEVARRTNAAEQIRACLIPVVRQYHVQAIPTPMNPLAYKLAVLDAILMVVPTERDGGLVVSVSDLATGKTWPPELIATPVNTDGAFSENVVVDAVRKYLDDKIEHQSAATAAQALRRDSENLAEQLNDITPEIPELVFHATDQGTGTVRCCYDVVLTDPEAMALIRALRKLKSEKPEG